MLGKELDIRYSKPLDNKIEEKGWDEKAEGISTKDLHRFMWIDLP